jgi:GrpB-like predicted nucleotidyltransferase (UPF0157 family)
VWAISVTQDIVISDYDPTWPAWFDTVRHHVWPAVKDVALRIDHVGSTAVPGLAAKPIIDLDIVVASDHDVRSVIEQLATIGYRWRGDLGVASYWQPDVDLPDRHPATRDTKVSRRRPSQASRRTSNVPARPGALRR